MITTVTSKGQVTVPVEARRKLGLEPGTKLEVAITEGGSLVFHPLTETVMSLKGVLPKPKKALSIEQMNEAIIEGAAGDRSGH